MDVFLLYKEIAKEEKNFVSLRSCLVEEVGTS